MVNFVCSEVYMYVVYYIYIRMDVMLGEKGTCNIVKEYEFTEEVPQRQQRVN